MHLNISKKMVKYTLVDRMRNGLFLVGLF